LVYKTQVQNKLHWFPIWFSAIKS